MQIIETMKLILKMGGLGCLIVVVAIVFAILIACLFNVLKTLLEERGGSQ